MSPTVQVSESLQALDWVLVWAPLLVWGLGLALVWALVERAQAQAQE